MSYETSPQLHQLSFWATISTLLKGPVPHQRWTPPHVTVQIRKLDPRDHIMGTVPTRHPNATDSRVLRRRIMYVRLFLLRNLQTRVSADSDCEEIVDVTHLNSTCISYRCNHDCSHTNNILAADHFEWWVYKLPGCSREDAEKMASTFYTCREGVEISINISIGPWLHNWTCMIAWGSFLTALCTNRIYQRVEITCIGRQWRARDQVQITIPPRLECVMILWLVSSINSDEI